MDTYEASWNEGNQAIAESVMWAADEGKPLVVTTASGRTVRMIPETGEQPAPHDPAAASPTDFDVEHRAKEHAAILALSFTPYLSSGPDRTIAPYGARITYRLETGAAAPTWHAAVSGNRVLENGTISMTSATVELRSQTDQASAPDWLRSLIEDHSPNW